MSSLFNAAVARCEGSEDKLFVKRAGNTAACAKTPGMDT